VITELLEKFEDLFTPHSPEEVEKRLPKWQVNFYVSDNTTKRIKSVIVKGPSQCLGFYSEIADNAVFKIGLPRDIINYTQHGGYTVEIRKSDGIKDDNGELMDGVYRMLFRMLDEDEE
jgi:hypothetical protein